MTAMSREGDIGDHERTWFEFRQDIFFTNADGDSSWLCEIGDSSSEECPVFHCIQNGKYLFTQGITVFSEKMRESSDTIYPCFWRRTKS